MSTPARSRTLLIAIAFAVVYIGWGTTYLANHFLLRELPPFVLGALRFFLAGGLALAYPVGLGLAAGAMIFVVSHEVIPETHRNGHQTSATLGLMAGFAVMMFLDTAMG